MTKHGRILALLVVIGISAASFGLLTAQEPSAIPKQRVSPKALKEALAERPVLTATAAIPHTAGRTIQDLRGIASDLEKAGHKSEAARLNSAIKEIIKLIEHDLTEKKSQVSRLNAEIEELKWSASQ